MSETEVRANERRRVMALIEAVDLYGWEAVRDALAGLAGSTTTPAATRAAHDGNEEAEQHGE